MTPENLSRGFGLLRPHGVSVAGPNILIEDGVRLRALANPNPLIDDPAV